MLTAPSQVVRAAHGTKGREVTAEVGLGTRLEPCIVDLSVFDEAGKDRRPRGMLLVERADRGPSLFLDTRRLAHGRSRYDHRER